MVIAPFAIIQQFFDYCSKIIAISKNAITSVLFIVDKTLPNTFDLAVSDILQLVPKKFSPESTAKLLQIYCNNS